MRPHRLRVTGFGAFAGTEQVCFDDLEGLFLLHGETGAGKTTLLDAIAFALYGKVPGVRGEAKRLRSDHATAGVVTEVELEATIGGRRLRIARKPEQDRPKRSGTGTVKEPASVRLEEATASGGWEVKSTRVGEADAEIKDLMGMSADQFFQVVLLPQGRFAQFLHADAKDRAELLQRLFGTDRFRAVEDWLAERRRTTTAQVTTAQDAVDLLLARVAQAAGTAVPVPAAAPAPGSATGGAASAEAAPGPAPGIPGPWQSVWAAGLAEGAAAERDAAADVAAQRKRDLDAGLARQRAAEQLADRQRRRAEALHRRARLTEMAPEVARLRDEADAAARAAEVAPVLNEADRAAAAAETASRGEDRARAAIAGEPATPHRDGSGAAPEAPADTAALRTAGPDTLREAGRARQARLGQLEALRAIERQAAQEDMTAADAAHRAAELDRTLRVAQAETLRYRETQPSAVASRDAARQAAADLPAVQAAADAARRVAADSAALVTERARRDRLHEAHLAAWERANKQRATALRVREARIDGMRAELAAALVDGAPCPVCGSLDHPELCELTGESVSREQERAANEAADRASAEADKAAQRVAAADAIIGELTQRLGDEGFTVPAEPAELSAAAAQAMADASRRDAEAGRIAMTATGLTDLQRGLDALEAAIAASAAKQVEVTEKRTAALNEADAATARAAAARGQLRDELGGAPDLAAALEAARRQAETLTAAADAADEAARTAAEARDAAERAIRAATDAGFGTSVANTVDAAREARREPRWRTGAAERISRHEAETQAVATLLADPDLEVPLEPPAPVAAATEAAAQARDQHDAAIAAHDRARHTAGQLATLRPQLTDALAALQPLKERAELARHLADLAGGLGANQYKMTLSSFVLAARLEEVAAAASERLLTMTAGRYSLVHTDARKGGAKSGLGLLACDSWTGVDRDTSTLSGGETFLASLALALGLADVVTAEAAGTPMEALFVDEGFGTLDEDTLDEVMNVLDGLREGGRIVGIVSHVTELRQRVPAQVHVRKGHHGSHVSVTAG